MPGCLRASSSACSLPARDAPVTIIFFTPAARARSSTASKSRRKDSCVRLAPMSISCMDVPQEGFGEAYQARESRAAQKKAGAWRAGPVAATSCLPAEAHACTDGTLARRSRTTDRERRVLADRTLIADGQRRLAMRRSHADADAVRGVDARRTRRHLHHRRAHRRGPVDALIL